MTSDYWKKVIPTALIISLAICKSSWIVMLFSWGGFSKSFYSAHVNLVNWPSVKLGWLPLSSDSLGRQGIDMGAALFGLRSTLADTLAWLPVGFVVAHLIWKSPKQKVA